MPIEPSLSADLPEEQDTQLLHLRRAALVEALGALVAGSDITRLRADLATLRSTLGIGGALRAELGDSDDVVVFPEVLLRGELAQIEAALSMERARYYVGRLIRAAERERTTAMNDIDLNRWKAYDDILTDSLWLIERRDSSGIHNANYWGNFVPQIPYQLMRRYTRRGDWVLDPFAGSGTTLIEGQRLGRNTLGVELQPAIAEHARSLVAAEPNQYGVRSEILVGDSTTTDFQAVLKAYGIGSVQLAILHPPYHDIIRFSDDQRDLSNTGSITAFLTALGHVVDRVAAVLDRGRYLALVIGDTYHHGEWIALGFQAMQTVQARNFLLKSIVVKDVQGTTGKRTQKELWRYRALAGGFYIFRHEYLFIFRKN